MKDFKAEDLVVEVEYDGEVNFVVTRGPYATLQREELLELIKYLIDVVGSNGAAQG